MRFNNFEVNLMLKIYTISGNKNRINIYTLSEYYNQLNKEGFGLRFYD